VEDSHSRESSNVHLNSDVSSKIVVDLSLLGGVDSGVDRGHGIVKALVSDFIDHLLMNINYNFA